MVVLIALVQFVIYPSFAEIAVDRFIAWHSRYTQIITWFVAPLMIGQVGLLGWLWFIRPSRVLVLTIAMVVIAWVATACVSVPCHNQLQATGLDHRVVARLIHTNWIRTVAWTLAFLFLLIAE